MTLPGRSNSGHKELVGNAGWVGPTDAPVLEPVPDREAHPLVTIMIPTYGQVRFLGRALDSALAQDYPNLEVVVSDDASPDGTPELMSLYAGESRVRYIRAASNRGRVGNYRHTLENLAMGDYALNLDGDDWLCDPSYISDAIELITHHPAVAMVFARSSVYDEAHDTYHEARRNVGLPVVNDGSDLLRAYAEDSVSIPHMTALYRRDSALDVGFYEVDVLGTDSVALLSLLPGRSVGFIDRTVGVWRKHASNATWSPDVAERVRNYAIADIPAAIAQHTGALNAADARRWQRDMAAVLAQSFVEDCLVHGRLGAVARFMLATLGQRPAVSALVFARLVRKGVSRLSVGNR